MAEPSASSFAGQFWYLYCIQSAWWLFPAGIVGVEGAPVGHIDLGDLRAVVSTLTCPDDPQEYFQRRVEEMEWLAPNAIAHDAVIGTMFERGTVLPVRFATIFRERESLEEMLEAQSSHLRSELTRLEGMSEWTIKVVIDPNRLRLLESEQGHDAEKGLDVGTAYLAQRKAERVQEERARERGAQLTGQAHERLIRLSESVALLAIPSREWVGDQIHITLNAAYLVKNRMGGPFMQVVNELREEFIPLGGDLILSGPTPPHHFCDIQGSSEKSRAAK
jgi:hypothetical protein